MFYTSFWKLGAQNFKNFILNPKLHNWYSSMFIQMNASLGSGISIYIFIDAETQVLHREGKRQFSMATLYHLN